MMKEGDQDDGCAPPYHPTYFWKTEKYIRSDGEEDSAIIFRADETPGSSSEDDPVIMENTESPYIGKWTVEKVDGAIILHPKKKHAYTLVMFHGRKVSELTDLFLTEKPHPEPFSVPENCKIIMPICGHENNQWFKTAYFDKIEREDIRDSVEIANKLLTLLHDELKLIGG
jgi:hypothetical protein